MNDSTTHEGLDALDDAPFPLTGSQAPNPGPVEATRLSGTQEAVDIEARRATGDVFMCPDDVMRYLKIGRSMCYALLADGKIPSYRVGRLRRVKKSDIDAWLEARRCAPWE